MKIEIPGVNTKKGLDFFEGDIETYLILLRSFVSSVPDVIETLKNVTAESLKNYHIAVHRLKGNSAHIGAEELRNSAVTLESMAKAGDLAGVQAQNEEFLKQAYSILDNVKNWLKQNDK
jgi:HPt (histidine-containing phosphotransfer) domain-containing protein